MFFSPLAVPLWGIFLCISAVMLFVQANAVRASFMQLAAFQAQHWALAITLLGITKVLHELGHAIVCRRMGARCREMGILLLCGIPCLYCDVTDSWRIPATRGRIAVMLAGIYVEWIVAALASWVWLLHDDPFAKSCAFHVLIVCSISTMLFNINPLMRYDGYYVVSDLLNVTHLRQRASEAWTAVVTQTLGGANYSGPVIQGERWQKSLLALYHGLSYSYQYLVAGVLSTWLLVITEKVGIAILGQLLVALIIVASGMAIAKPMIGVLRGKFAWMHVPRWRRFLLTGGTLGLLVMLAVLPFQRRIRAEGRIEYAAATSIYAGETGTLTHVAKEFGETVATGEVLFQLAEPALAADVLRAELQTKRINIQLASMLKQSHTHPEMREQLSSQQRALLASEVNLRMTRSRFEQLTIHAPRDGIVMRPPNVEHQRSDSLEVSQGDEMPLLQHQQGRLVRPGDILCCIGREDLKQALLECSATQRRHIAVGDTVMLQLGHLSSHIVSCRVSSISVIEQTSDNLPTSDQHRFTIACQLPSDVALMSRVNMEAVGVLRGEQTCLGELFWEQLSKLLN
jgi:putative peptide zinc metalloprotease protein